MVDHEEETRPGVDLFPRSQSDAPGRASLIAGQGEDKKTSVYFPGITPTHGYWSADRGDGESRTPHLSGERRRPGPGLRQTRG
jgi:hypothetical protein